LGDLKGGFCRCSGPPFFSYFCAMLKALSILPLLIFLSPAGAQTLPDSTTKITRQWTLSHDFSEEVPLEFDTVFSLFHRYRITDRYSALNASPGNYGLPFYQLNFFDRPDDPDRFLAYNYYPFMYLPERPVFMDTQVPFSEMVWTYGTPRETSEQTFRVRHSQNVNRNLNFGLIYDIVYSLGQYNYQRAENKTFTFFSSYKGNSYRYYFAAGVNNIKSHENGGVTDPGLIQSYETRDVPVNMGGLNESVSLLKNRNILFVQRYTVGGSQGMPDTLKTGKKSLGGLSGTFSHIMIWENNKRTYSDNYAAGGFYDTTYISSSVTFDSLYSSYLKNTLRFDFSTDESRKFRLGGGFGIRNEIHRYSQIVPTHDTLFADTLLWKRNNNVVVGRLYNNIGNNFRWVADGELYLSGSRAGDFNLRGEIMKSFSLKKGEAVWKINGRMLSVQPSFWMLNWGSNHFEWHNNFDRSFRIDAGTLFSYPGMNTNVRLNYTIADNYTGFNTMALPFQHGGGLSIVSLMASKGFTAWKFHFANDLLIQQSSNAEVVDLPLVTLRSSAYFEHLFRFEQTQGELNMQLGAEVTFHTMYYPYAYMPATGRFYNQADIREGNYPFINAFLNLKLKRTRFFIMFDHVNHGLLGSGYCMIPNYPMNIRMLRYGLAWTFYN